MYLLFCLYNLFSQFIQGYHIANLKICPTVFTMMGKTMFVYISMSG